MNPIPDPTVMNPITDPTRGQSPEGAELVEREARRQLVTDFIREVAGRGESYLLDRFTTAAIIELNGREKEEIAKLAELADMRVGTNFENRALYTAAFDPELSATDTAPAAIKKAYSDGIVLDRDSGLFRNGRNELANLARMARLARQANKPIAPKYVLIVWVDKENS